MLESELSYLKARLKQLGEDFRTNSPWRVPVNFRCNQEVGKPHQGNGIFPYANARNTDCRCCYLWQPLITHGGEEFLYDDGGWHDLEILPIFATPWNLGVLENSGRWYCDGTFGISPDVFYQVYIIHGETPLTNTYVIPLLYALLLNKEQLTYSSLSKALNFRASSVTIDFEIAVGNCLKKIASDVEISFCYFPFFQSLLQLVTNHGKKSRYGEAEVFLSDVCAYGRCPCVPAGQRCNQGIWTTWRL